jgi:hypothetical protein
MATQTRKLFRLSSLLTSAVWSEDEAFLTVHCEESNFLRFFARGTSDIFKKKESGEIEDATTVPTLKGVLTEMVRETLVGKVEVNYELLEFAYDLTLPPKRSNE